MANNIPSANNALNPLGMFVQRKNYKDALPKAGIPELADLHHKIKLYGKVNKRSEAVIPKENLLSLVNEKEGVVVLNFVADAFTDLKNTIKTGILSGKLEANSQYSKMEAKIGWKNPKTLYHEFMKLLYKAFSEEFIPRNGLKNKIIDFPSFLVYFMSFIETSGKKYPFLFSSFIFSNLCPNNVSGLFVEISTDDFAEDKDKFNKFISDRNFYAVTKLAERFGFIIDKNAPWRFIANIGSNKMEKYLQKQSFSFDNIFSRAYNAVYLVDFDLLQVYLIQFYNSIIHADPNGQIKWKKEDVADNKWLDIFLSIKMLERFGSINKKVLKQEINKLLPLWNTTNKQNVLFLISQKYSNDNIQVDQDELSLQDINGIRTLL